MTSASQLHSTIEEARTKRLLATDYSLKDATVEITLTPGTMKATVPQTGYDVRRQIFRAIYSVIGRIDDGDADWLTNSEGHTFICDKNCMISDDPRIAALVDAANVITLGRVLRVEDEEGGAK